MSGADRTRILAGLVLLVTALALSGCIGSFGVLGGTDGPSPAIEFEEATNESGLNYTDAVGSQTGVGNASVYAADLDRDGWTDLVTSGDGETGLWINRQGTFERAPLPDVEGPVKSVSVIDYDGDGWEDLILFPEYGNATALHNERGTFERDDVGLGNYSYPLGGTAADYDGDGDQDLLIHQSGDWANGKPYGYFWYNDTLEEDNGNPNYLYENVGGEFERVTDAGIEGTRWSLAASFVDLNDDGHPDIHIANDYNSDVVYRNQGDGTFEQVILGGNTSRNGMASEVSDVNGDGRPDVFSTNIEFPLDPEVIGEDRYEAYKRLNRYIIHSTRTKGNTLLINRENGTFSEEAGAYDVQTGGWGWAASHVDLNNDGTRDYIHATQNVINSFPDDHVFTYPMVFERTGENFTRLDASEIGLQEDDGRGMVTLDYDRDGQMELISANYVERYTVYDNAANDSQTHALEFEAVDEQGATAYGATVEVDAGQASRTVFQHSRTDYLSREPGETHVGLGARESATLTVTWPDGTERTFDGVAAGQFVQLHRNGTVETVVEFRD